MSTAKNTAEIFQKWVLSKLAPEEGWADVCRHDGTFIVEGVFLRKHFMYFVPRKLDGKIFDTAQHLFDRASHHSHCIIMQDLSSAQGNFTKWSNGLRPYKAKHNAAPRTAPLVIRKKVNSNG